MTAPDRILKVDDTWSVEFDPANNDRPLHWYRHGERHSEFDENNAVTALFYALLEDRPTPLAEALAAAQAYIEDLEAHEGAEGFSTSTAKLGATYYAALRAIGERAE